MTEIQGKITKQLLKCRSGEFDVESIHSLMLRRNDISELGCLGECVGLERLDLSFNDITRLYALAGLTNLTYLNLSANRIQSLEGLQALDNLAVLNLAGNLIGSTDALLCISSLEKLSELRLKDTVKELSNPMCLNLSYKSEVTAMLPKLSILDGERLSGKGSSLFKLYNELDNLLEARKSSSNELVPSVQPWLPEKFFEPEVKFEETLLGDAEEQLEMLLSECHRMTNTVDAKLQAAGLDTSKLKGAGENMG